MECGLTLEYVKKTHPNLAPLFFDKFGDHWLWTECRDKDDKPYVGTGSQRRDVLAMLLDLMDEAVPVGYKAIATCTVARCINPAHLEYVVVVPKKRGRPRRRLFINGKPQLRNDERRLYLTYEQFLERVRSEGWDVDIDPELRDLSPVERYERLTAAGISGFARPVALTPKPSTPVP